MRITDEKMTSDVTWHVARWRPDAAADGGGAWVVSWMPERLLDRNQAVTAMTLAERVTAQPQHAEYDAHVIGWAHELDVTVDWAMTRLRDAEG